MSVSIDDCTDTIYDHGFEVATVARRCCACNDTIAIGHRFRRASTDGEDIEDEEVDTSEDWDQCLRCAAIHDHLLARMEGDEVPEWSLDCGHGYRERWGEEPPPEIAELAFRSGADLQEPSR